MNDNLNPSPNAQTMSLKIQTKTWARDSHGLFDYEAQNIKSTVLITNEIGKLIRKKHDVKQVANEYDITLEDRELANIHIENGKLCFYFFREILYF